MTMSLSELAKQALSFMDLTTLNDDDTHQAVATLCAQAASAQGQVAALCIYPRFIPQARKVLRELGVDVKIATVTNFPLGGDDIDIAVAETKAAVAYGADEVDVVFPWRALVAGNEQVGFDLVKQCKAACGDAVLLKVIIESGELNSQALIVQASEIAIKAGADFIKTSTGKVPVNATPEAAKWMLQTIAQHNVNCGFKAAGGVKSAEQAKIYLDLASDILGEEWLSAAHFRFGASSLLAALQSTIAGDMNATATKGY